MENNLLVRDVMTRSPYKVTPDTTLLECTRMMVRKRVNSLSITNKKKLVGFVSQKDILWALVKKPTIKVLNTKAIDLSPKKVITTKPTATIEEVINKMNKFRFDRIPVVNNKELVGIITVRDILSFHPELYPELEEFARIREEQNKLNRIKKADIAAVDDGICEECGDRGALYRINGMLICSSCSSSI